MIFSFCALAAPNGFVMGAVFGAMIAQLAWWPWVYWTMSIACCLVGTLSFIVIPSPTKKASSNTSVDCLGSIVGAAGRVLFNASWNQAPLVGWSTPYVYVTLILGSVFVTIFVFIGSKVAQPLIPKGVLSGKTGFVLGCIARGWSSFGIWIYYLHSISSHF